MIRERIYPPTLRCAECKQEEQKFIDGKGRKTRARFEVPRRRICPACGHVHLVEPAALWVDVGLPTPVLFALPGTVSQLGTLLNAPPAGYDQHEGTSPCPTPSTDSPSAPSPDSAPNTAPSK